MEDYPILVYVGAGILAWTAGSIIVPDKIIGSYLNSVSHALTFLIPITIVGLVLIFGYLSGKGKKK